MNGKHCVAYRRRTLPTDLTKFPSLHGGFYLGIGPPVIPGALSLWFKCCTLTRSNALIKFTQQTPTRWLSSGVSLPDPEEARNLWGKCFLLWIWAVTELALWINRYLHVCFLVTSRRLQEAHVRRKDPQVSYMCLCLLLCNPRGYNGFLLVRYISSLRGVLLSCMTTSAGSSASDRKFPWYIPPRPAAPNSLSVLNYVEPYASAA